MMPIVFIHSFNHDYLSISLWKAKETNPDAEIFLIGDLWNAHFGGLVTHIPQKKYSKGATELARNFVNFSTNPSDFELVCLQRWMILEEFMKERNFEKCLYIDSDVLLFDDIRSDAERFSTFGMTVAGISGHTNFIQDRNVLSDFCQWIQSAYSSSLKIKEAEEKYKEFCKTHSAGGISDMTYFTEFRIAHPSKILDISEPMDGKMFDITITYTKGVKSENGIKALTWRKEKPWVIDENGSEIELRSLHFQGDSKQYMLQMARISSLPFRTLFYINNTLILIQKGIRKILR
jgi:hypothetical protein